MDIAMLIEILQDCPDKSLPILLPLDGGFITVCASDSGVAQDDDGDDVFVLMPCFCHIQEEKIELEVRADDFEENLN